MIKLRRLRCSFCRKNETEVAKLVAGPRAYICDACVEVASRIMGGDADNDNRPPEVEPTLWRKLWSRARQLLTGGTAHCVNSPEASR